MQSIPFENLDILLNRGISIEPAAVEAKLLHSRRGGYCFEHNTLLSHVLEGLGFSVTVLSARGRYQAPPGVQRPRTHVLLRVELEGESYLVDGGFGGLSPTSALRMVLNAEQETPHERRRIVSEGAWDGFSSRSPDALLIHQAYLTDGWRDLFEFTLEPMPVPDREMGNWYTSTSPRSRFREALMVARATDKGRVTLQDLELTQRANDGTATTRVLTSRRELLDALAEHFQLRFPSDTRFESPGLTNLA
ncbi:MAG TPA: arylamine N-acetyltransferase [Polyangiaceae bacterium]|nr:arylamine N-acetyltransferase [Polyangiaceae bacterium]